MYEHRRDRLLPRVAFLKRLAVHALGALVIVAISLVIGMAGYERFENLEGTDAFLNAAMLLGGMGPVNCPITREGKLFAGSYALYAGLVFVFSAGIILAPIAHRVLHRLHLDDKQ